MTHFTTLASRLLIASAVAMTALPAVAFDGPGGFQEGGNGPDPWEPGDLAPNPGNSGGGGGGGGAAVPGGDGHIANSAPNPCPNGELVVNFDLDEDGHPIPSSFSRHCVIYR